jgi:hypothetical protein
MKNMKAKNRLRGRPRTIFFKGPTFKFFEGKIESYIEQSPGFSTTYELFK